MLFTDSYYTVTRASTGLFKDRGSKFIGYAFPVSNEEEIKAHLADLKKEHVGARHWCYAWRLGADKSAWRTNDDGEPSNSAGKPIYSQIQSKDLTNVLVVVVRYFGGTLLGIPGLINAYKNAAAEAIAQNSIEERFIYHEYEIVFTVNDMNAIMKLCKDLDVLIASQDYEEGYTLRIRVKKSLSEQLEEKIKHIYNAKLTYIKTI
jgi:uncharacterized YigZ family protein